VVSELWNTLLEYLRRTPYWSKIEPVALAAFLYVGVSVVAFQYLQWRYQVSLSLPLFLGSYLFKQVSVAFWALVLAYVVLTYGAGRSPRAAEPGAEDRRVVSRPARLASRAAAVFIILAVALFAWQRLSPHSKVSSIRVVFAPSGEFLPSQSSAPEPATTQGQSPPPLDLRKAKEALVYILFELNRLQRTWHFEVDLTPFTKDMVSGKAERACGEAEDPLLCFAEAYYAREHGKDPLSPPIVVITPDQLDPIAKRNWFWLHRGAVSVITTHDWEGYAAPSVYEYLTYTILLQGLLIHLDAHCGGIPPRPSEREGIIYGNAFEYHPRREGMKASILSGHLGPDDERLLLNCFGAEYMRAAAELLRLEWLRSNPVRANLRSVYGVDPLGNESRDGAYK